MKNIRSFSMFRLLQLIIMVFLGGATFAQNSPMVENPDSIVQVTTIFPGSSKPQTVTVSAKNGSAILEGDINLGSIAELRSVQDRGLVHNDALKRWPAAEIPYFIWPGFTPQYVDSILMAIDYINATTHVLIVPRTNQPDYVQFMLGTVCESFVGKAGGIQTITLKDPFIPGNNDGCYFPQIIHEIAHAAGVWHEQSRVDRDVYVTVHLDNVKEEAKHNFDMHVTDAIPFGLYDFGSVMHYSWNAFAINTSLPTITANGGQPFGNAPEYSTGDIATINYMYPVNNCPANMTLSKTIRKVSRLMALEASNTITSSATIVSGNNMVYDGGVLVRLTPGFIAQQGSTFLAVNEGCGGVYQRGSDPEVDEWLAQAELNKAAHQQGNTNLDQNVVTDLTVSPNPFSGSTMLSYTLPQAQEVNISVLNPVGQLVAQPVRQEFQEAGVYTYPFHAEGLPPGIYFLVLQTGSQKVTKRMVLAH